MSNENVCVNLYQNSYGEIYAFVSYTKDGIFCNKLIENVERFAVTPESMFEYLVDGFSDFSDYICQKHEEKSINDILIEMTEDGGYKLIVHFEFNGISTDYFFENMHKSVFDLFRGMKNITDKKASEFERYS